MSHWLENYFNNSISSNNNYATFTYERPIYSFPWVRKNEHHNYSLPVELKIKKIIFNGPATIVLWTDNTKTVVKCAENDEFDPEKGVAMAIWKKFLPMQYGRKGDRMINNARKNVGKTGKPKHSCFYCKHYDSIACIDCIDMGHYEGRDELVHHFSN